MADGAIVILEMCLVGSERVSDTRKRVSEHSSQMCTAANGIEKQKGRKDCRMKQGQPVQAETWAASHML